MGGYVGARAGSLLATTAAEVQDLTATDTTPEVTIVNSTHEDTDGGREGKVTFKGQQSGGEESTLAQIQASHDGTSDDEKGDLIFKTNDGSDNVAPTEAFRVDSAQNLLVGTATANPTSSAVNNAGQEFSATGGVRSTVASNAAATFNRKTDNGAAVLFRKDGTTVGNIGVIGGSGIHIGNNSTGGIRFGTSSGSTLINPCDESGTVENNLHDLGSSSSAWRNLYLGGGAYIGGTGAANHLDDYEEGTWTPSLTFGGGNTSLVFSTNQGYYTKVGRHVHLTFYMQLSNRGSSTGGARLVGLPFTTNSVAASRGGGSFTYFHNANTPSNFGQWMLLVESAQTEASLRYFNTSSSAMTEMPHTSFNNNTAFFGQLNIIV